MFALAQPRFEQAPAFTFAGFAESYTRDQIDAIPQQWQAFSQQAYASGLPFEISWAVVYPLPVMRYVTVIEVAGAASLPEGWAREAVPAQQYAIFSGAGGVPAMRSAWQQIFSAWLPTSGRKQAEGPMLERYTDDWMTTGDFEIWIPVV